MSASIESVLELYHHLSVVGPADNWSVRYNMQTWTLLPTFVKSVYPHQPYNIYNGPTASRKRRIYTTATSKTSKAALREITDPRSTYICNFLCLVGLILKVITLIPVIIETVCLFFPSLTIRRHLDMSASSIDKIWRDEAGWNVGFNLQRKIRFDWIISKTAHFRSQTGVAIPPNQNILSCQVPIEVYHSWLLITHTTIFSQ